MEPGTTSGSPARLIGLPIFSRAPISQLFSGFLGSPGPIYSGIPIASNSNPLTLQSSRPITGGYASNFAVPTNPVDDCGCGEAVESFDPVVEVPYMEPVVDEYGTMEGAIQEQPVLVDDSMAVSECQSCQEVAVPCDNCSGCGSCCGCGGGGGGGVNTNPAGVLFRLRNWLHR